MRHEDIVNMKHCTDTRSGCSIFWFLSLLSSVFIISPASGDNLLPVFMLCKLKKNKNMAWTQSNRFGKLLVSGHKTLCCSCLSLKRFTIFSQTFLVKSPSVAVTMLILPERTSETEQTCTINDDEHVSSLLLLGPLCLSSLRCVSRLPEQVWAPAARRFEINEINNAVSGVNGQPYSGHST